MTDKEIKVKLEEAIRLGEDFYSMLVEIEAVAPEIVEKASKSGDPAFRVLGLKILELVEKFEK